MSGCIGSAACKCTQYVQIANTSDCYTCGHFAKEHRNLGRISVEGEVLNKFREFWYLFRGKKPTFLIRISLSFLAVPHQHLRAAYRNLKNRELYVSHQLVSIYRISRKYLSRLSCYRFTLHIVQWERCCTLRSRRIRGAVSGVRIPERKLLGLSFRGGARNISVPRYCSLCSPPSLTLCTPVTNVACGNCPLDWLQWPSPGNHWYYNDVREIYFPSNVIWSIRGTWSFCLEW